MASRMYLMSPLVIRAPSMERRQFWYCTPMSSCGMYTFVMLSSRDMVRSDGGDVLCSCDEGGLGTGPVAARGRLVDDGRTSVRELCREQRVMYDTAGP